MKVGFKHALNGIFLMGKSEKNVRIHFVLFLLVVCTGFFFQLSKLEWIAVLLCSAMVFCLEMVNSALEKICDKITTEKDVDIKWIKDVAAGSVLVASFFSLIIAFVIFAPYFYLLLWS